MAYKFQIGPAILSGSIKAEDGLVSTDVDDATAANVVAQIDAGEIPIAKLAAKTISGKDLGSNLDSLSVDDSSIEFSAGSAFNGSAASAIRVKAAGITNAMLAGSIASSKIAELSAFDTGDLSEGSNLYYTDERVDDRVGALVVGGDAVSATYDDAAGSLTLAAQVDGSSIEISSDALRVKALGITNAMLAGSIENGKLVNSTISGKALGSNLDSLSVDDASIEFSAGSAFNGSAASAIRVKASGITNAMLQGSIENGKLVNSTISGKALGANLDALTTANDSGLATISYNGSSAVALAVELDGAGGLAKTNAGIKVDAAGITNAMLSGSIASSKIAELNAFDTGDLSEGSNLYYTDARARLAISRVDAGGDGSLAYNNSTGVITYTGPSASEVRAHLSVADSNSMDMSYSSGQFSADLRLASADALVITADGLDLKATIDGNKTFSNDVVISGDLTVNGTSTTLNVTNLDVQDHNIRVSKNNASAGPVNGAGLTIEGGSGDDLTFEWQTNQMHLKHGAAFATLKAGTFIGSLEGAVSQTITAIADADGSLEVGFNYGSADTTALRTWTLPASPLVGQVVHVKAPSSVHADGIKIQKAGSQTIDGEDFIVLESPYAAVNLMYVASNVWRVY